MLPRRLRRGDTIGLVTVSAPEAAEHPQNVDKGINHLKSLGFNVKPGRYAFSNEHGHLANKPILLAEDLNNMFMDPNIAGILCTGGGTNANRTLPYIDYEIIGKNPKIFVGMSNPTIILNAITSMTGLITFHGPALVWNWGGEMPDYTETSFLKITTNKKTLGQFPKNTAWDFIKPGKAKGRLFGGNLWSVQSLIGTQYEPSWNGAIFFWEDIAKEPKRIDAMLTHFKLAGVFEQISGMVIGELVGCSPQGSSLDINEIVLELTKEFDFPILSGICFGHTDEKLTLPIGANVSLNSQDGTFSLVESVVK
jgi:muramoyltetrapeptide carboxypeptidase